MHWRRYLDLSATFSFLEGEGVSPSEKIAGKILESSEVWQ